MADDDDTRLIVLGRVSGIFGVSGWVRIYSYTDPRENILQYSHWHLPFDGEWRRLKVEDGRRQGKAVVARLEGCDDRDQARALMGCNIALPRAELPPLQEGEYYWFDLQGLRVYNREGVDFGTVSHLMATGANDVLVVHGERERLIPLVLDQFVHRVDLEAGVIEVDWDSDF
ncbi:ribosome maturation factor RimM [Aquisalimonas sp.]|uniref:ribosome maturation factor RimM n=1 Tax=Aquisalimonas sp. TaxID=1872621 RepID=UPI0025C021FF|nr:ribosome maturation factor RimM [Aquisalimonas sp.]